MPALRAGLVARLTLPQALSALTEAAVWLDAHGATPVVEAQSAAAAGLAGRWLTVARPELARQVDVVIAFGGDGTLLDAAGAVAQAGADVPLLGVNLGHLGFLTEVGRDELDAALETLVAGRARVESRTLLAGRIERGAAVAAEHAALNDIVVTRGALSRMIEIDVTVDGQFVCHVKADGLILATATGSTAYNLSAGGPIVHPSVDAVVLTPIAPHTLTNRPIVLPAGSTVVLEPAIEPSASDIVVTFDGQFGAPLHRGDHVVIERSPRVLRLLRTSSRTHFDMLREKLKWGHQ
ncbi:MAG TPA: NAD(+)/NADH kinase [Vicinamibacterales bacterium]|nr:NAD(+)/NADH kinase [Vicinamibacterales bacterium]